MGFSEERVTSAQNKYVSEARMLTEKKRRDRSSLFRFDGVKLLCEAVKNGVEIEYLLVCEGAYDRVFAKAEQTYGITRDDINCRIIPVLDTLFEKISEEKSPEGVICVAKYIDKFHKFVKINNEENFSASDDERILLLESVRDPLNVGAIIRVAVAMGADRIIMSSDCADIYNSKAVRASMGTVFGMRIDIVDDICAAVAVLKESGRRVFAAALDENASRLGQIGVTSRDCILIGNEGHGLSDRIIDRCGNTIYIPMHRGVESLNAATAASLLLWEFFGR